MMDPIFIGVVSVTAAAALFGGLMYTDRYFDRVCDTAAEKKLGLRAKLLITAAFLGGCVFLTAVSGITAQGNFYTIGTVTALCGMTVSAVTDIKTRLIPNTVCAAMIAAWLVEYLTECIFFGGDLLTELIASLIGAAFGGGLLFIGRLISKNGMGMGDIKLMFSAGLLMKFDGVFGVLFWGFVLSLIYSVILLALKKAKRDTLICMAPFFLAGAVISKIFLFISYLNYPE